MLAYTMLAYMNAYTNAFLYLVSAYALTLAGYHSTSSPCDAAADDDDCIDIDFSTAQEAPAWLVRAPAEIITSPLDEIDY